MAFGNPMAGAQQTTENWQKRMQQLAASSEDLGHTGAAVASQTPVTNPAQKFGGPGDTTNTSGQYYSGYTDLGRPYYLNNPQELVKTWADFYNQGQGRAAMFNQNFDPNSILTASGEWTADPEGRMATMGSLLDTMSGRGGVGTGPNKTTHLNPQGMLGNVLGAAYDPKNPSQLTSSIMDPSMAPETRVNNTIGLILSSLQGSVDNQSLNAYANFLTNEKRLYMDFISRPQSGPVPEFNQWLQSRHGSGGGLF